VEALRRYEKELLRLKALRENEKATFIHHIQLSRELARETAAQRSATIKQNQNFI
jgi:hypothetical protein